MAIHQLRANEHIATIQLEDAHLNITYFLSGEVPKDFDIELTGYYTTSGDDISSIMEGSLNSEAVELMVVCMRKVREKIIGGVR